jgi:hypothetical protein
MTEFPESTSDGSRHPGDDELLAFLDSELSLGELERVRVHVNDCSKCRAELAALTQVLGSIQQFHDSQVAETQGLQNSDAVERFRARLEQHVQEKLPRSLNLLPPETRQSSWKLTSLLRYRIPVLASIVAFALVLATTVSLLETRVSADVLLTRTEQKEGLPAFTDTPVTRSVLRIEILDASTGKEETLNEYILLADNHTHEARIETDSGGPSSGEWAASGKDFFGDLSVKAFGAQRSFDQALLHYMREQNFFPDTSATQFRKLVASRGSVETHVHKGDGSYGLDYAFAEDHPSGIRNAVLWVTKKSYDPFQLSIFAANGAGSKEYRFTRKSRVFERRTPEVARLLSGYPNPLVPAPSSGTPHAPAILPLRYAQIPASPSEVGAAVLLHKLNACMGEEVYAYPMSDGTTLVQGLVENTHRRQMLTNALAHADAAIHPEIYTPDQLNSGAHLLPSPYGDLPASAFKSKASPAEQATDLSGRQMAFHDELMASLQSEGKGLEEAEKLVGTFSTDLSVLSGELLLNSWALERLDEEFPALRTTQLATTYLEVLDSLRREHRQQIQELAHRESLMLARIQPVDSTDHTRGLATNSPREALELAQQQEKLVRALFAASQQSARKSEDLSRLVQILRLLEN